MKKKLNTCYTPEDLEKFGSIGEACKHCHVEAGQGLSCGGTVKS